MKAKGVSIGRVWEDWQKWSVEADKQAKDVSAKPYADAVEEWKQRKLKTRKTRRYVESSADVLMKFGKGRERQPIHEILHSELESWLDAQADEHDWSSSTKRTYTLHFSSLWEVAVDKGWATFNITDRLEPITVNGPAVRIYPNKVILLILAGVLDNELTRKVLAPVVLCLFGCMRPEEVTSEKARKEGLPSERFFGWHDVDLKHGRITVRPETAKKGDQRTIRLQPTPREWLKLAKQFACELPPVNERRLVDQACELIDLRDWIRDGLRKCCATHLREVHKNDYDVVKDMGNSVRVLLKHYADLHVTPEESKEFWSITPEKVEKFRKTKEWEAVKKLFRFSRNVLFSGVSQDTFPDRKST